MKRLPAILCLLWAVVWASLGVYGAVSNPRATAFTVQGPDATGNLGFPIAVVQATGATWPTTFPTGSVDSNGRMTQTWPSNMSAWTSTIAGAPLLGYAEGSTTARAVGAAQVAYNGTNGEILRTVNTTTNTTGTGILGTAAMGWDGTNYQRLPVDTNNQLKVTASGWISTPSANFTRPSDTTAYAVGDLVANSVTAGSVVPMSWTAARVAAGSAMIRRVRLQTSSTSTTNASFRLHLYAADPSASTGITNGDNGAWLTKVASYLGAIDVTVDKAFSDAARGNGVPMVGNEISFSLGSGQTIYGLLEARAAYTPTSAEVFTCELELLQN